MNIINKLMHHETQVIASVFSNITDITDIEDINNNIAKHIDKEYKDNNIFNGLMVNIAEEFNNNIENFKNASDIDKFKKNIQKKYKYTISNAEFIKIYKHLNLENQQLRNIITKKKCK